MTLAISLDNINKFFGNFQAIKNLTLTIPEGIYLALLGPNGAGKTTLVEMIEGIQKPSSGRISIHGMNWEEHEKELRKILGFSLQETRFIDKLTTEETLSLFGSLYSAPKSKVKELLELTGLDSKAKTYVENLSGGQKQKLALCVAIINSPKILILDEPTTGLDPKARREIWDILLKLKTQKTTLILTTHYMEEAEKLCDRIVFVNNGSILADGNLQELLLSKNMSDYIEIESEQQLDISLLLSLPQVKNITEEENGKKLQIYTNDSTEFLEYFFHYAREKSIKIKSLQSRKMTLDDLFLKLSGRHLED
ncbi:MAG: ABC transporter ATP-binding protein [Candidatus Pacearchaeota archaeon]